MYILSISLWNSLSNELHQTFEQPLSGTVARDSTQTQTQGKFKDLSCSNPSHHIMYDSPSSGLTISRSFVMYLLLCILIHLEFIV